MNIYVAAALQGLLSRGISPERCIPEAIDIGTRVAKAMAAKKDD